MTDNRFAHRRAGWAVALALLAAMGAGWHFYGGTELGSLVALAADPVNPADLAHAEGLSKAFRAAADMALPTVVTIQSETKAHTLDGIRNGENPFKGTPFEDFFKENPGFNFERRIPRQSGLGSGVIIDGSGVILTNNHVVADADEVTVTLADGREFKGTDIHVDPDSDLAVVHIKDAGTLPAAKMGDSDALEIGDWVIAVGNPFGLEQTVSAGIISGKGRALGQVERASFLQTDAAINPGNSGGPLLNLRGEVIGINTAIASNTGSYQGIGFAVPINLAKWVSKQLVDRGQVERAYLGVGIQAVNADLAQQFDIPSKGGVVVSEVYPDSPAEEAGLKETDVIVKFGGNPVHDPRELQELVERAPLGSKQDLTVLRDGKTVTLTVVAKSLPENFGRTARRSRATRGEENEPDTAASNALGIEVSDLTEDVAKQLGFEGRQGVVITGVEPNSVADEAGLRDGMLILKVGRQPVTTAEEFDAAMKEQSLENGVMLHVRTEQGNRYIVLQSSGE